MDAVAYKKLHESAMLNNNGSSIAEVFVTIVPSYFYSFLAVNLFTVASPLQVPAKFLLEFSLCVATIILNLTVLNNKIWEISSSLLVLTLTAAGRQLYKRTHVLPFVVQIPAKRPDYIVMVRATVNLVTAISILAVDFRCFPRKLAKTETFGFGFMDVGVGLYVFSNGIVDGLAQHNAGITMSKLYKLIVATSPLLVLGLVRFFVTNELDYQQHVSEYGVHWNFFVTLALTKVLGSLVLLLLSDRQKCKFAAVIVVTCHQMGLQLGLAKWVTSESVKRDNWLSANREGLVSVPGYVGLYLACVYVGTLLRAPAEVVVERDEYSAGDDPTVRDADTITARQLLRKVKILGFHVMVLWKITYDCNSIFGVSRRLANMGYVLWVLSIATSITMLFMLLEVFYYFLAFEQTRPETDRDENDGRNRSYATSYCPVILAAINYNGLAFFLGANLLTGLINLTFQTLLVSPAGCVFIVTVYMFVLCAIATFLYVNQIKIKIW